MKEGVGFAGEKEEEEGRERNCALFFFLSYKTVFLFNYKTQPRQ